MPRKRLSRAEKQAETRAELLAAGARVFARRGYEAASVEEIAEEAGFSRGAFYSNFGGKEELFLAVIEQRTEDILGAVANAFQQGSSATDRIYNGGRFLDDLITRDQEWCKLYFEFWSVSVRTPKLRRRFARQYTLWRAAIADLIASQADELGVDLDAPAEEFSTAVIALFEGFLLQKLIDPGFFPDGFFARLLTRFFGRLGALDAPRAGSGR